MNKHEVLIQEFNNGTAAKDWEAWGHDVASVLAKLTAGVELPPLPDADHVIHLTDSETVDCFRADQVREAQRQAIAADRARLAGQEAVATTPCVVCGEVTPYTGTCGSASPRALCNAAPVPAQAEKVEVEAVAWANYDEAMKDPLFQQARALMGTANFGQDDALRQAILHVLSKATPPTALHSLRDAALKRIADVGVWEEYPGHHNNALHHRCKSCCYRWAVGIEQEHHADECAAQIARAALQEHGRKVRSGLRLCCLF